MSKEPTNSEFIEGARALLRQGANDAQWEFATLLRKACDRLGASEQQPSSELIKEANELDKMCVSEIVAKYGSSHNAITVLKRKFRAACESDEWMKSATEFYENGGCPICFSTDEAGCTKGCYLGSLMQQRKDLLEACKGLIDANEYAKRVSLRDEPPRGIVWGDVRSRLDVRKLKAKAAIAKAEKEG